jgi:hypothetical protein
MMADAPIAVNPTPLPGAIATLVRQGLLGLAGLAAAKGWFSLGDNLVEQYIVPVGLFVATFAYGQVKTWVLHSKLAKLTGFLPDSVAFFK